MTGDDRLVEAHNTAVIKTLEHLERFGSTTRKRCDGRRLHPDSHGLTAAVFQQSTSRDDDPQLHTHAVISAKVQTLDGEWLALDARYLKRHQRMLGGLYQSLLRSELTARLGVGWERIVNGQAEIAGAPKDLLAVLSKRSVEIAAAVAVKVEDFVDRQGRPPTRVEHATLARQAAKETRGKKTGIGVADLVSRWCAEAQAVGWSPAQVTEAIQEGARELADQPVAGLTVGEVIEDLSQDASTWVRADVLQALCDRLRPRLEMPAGRWLTVLERAAEWVVEHCVNLDPTDPNTRRRASDGRSLWIEPTAPGLTSEAILVQEERIVAWALDAQTGDPAPSATVDRDGLDVFQGDAAAAVAGHDPLVLVVGPAGAGKTRTLTAARHDLHTHARPLFGLAPTAKAARTLERDTGIVADTVAKLLYEWSQPERGPEPRWRLGAGTTVVVDEAGMLATPSLHHLITLAQQNRWRLALVGDQAQLQAVGRGGLFDELRANGRVHQLEHVHRFTHPWEAQATLQLRVGDPQALDAYQQHGRILAGTLEQHLGWIANRWRHNDHHGHTTALVAATNEHVDAINTAVHTARITAHELDPDTAVDIGGGEVACVGEVVATRRNDRRLVTTTGEPVRNRELWTVTATHPDGSLTVTHNDGHGHVTLPTGYVQRHVRLGYAATEPGYQSDTVTCGVELASMATTRRGLYVAVTRGHEENWICVITDTADVTEARDTLERILAVDRADIPAVTQRRRLAEQDHDIAPATRREQPGRCEIPDWFNQLRDHSRAELADVTQRAAANAAGREQLETHLEAARAVRDRLEEPTRRERERLVAAQHEAEAARRDLATAEHQLDTCGIRGRRHARRDLATAENRLTWANHTLEKFQAATNPDVDHYHCAWHQVRDLRAALRSHETTELFDRYATTDRIPHLQQRLDALDTWWRFATGDSIDVDRLSEIVEILGNVHDDRGHYRWLTQTVTQHAIDAGIQLPTLEPQTPSIEPAGVHIGL